MRGLYSFTFYFLHTAAYKESDRLHIMGKRVLVDVERGRTVRGWKPRRLGGGLLRLLSAIVRRSGTIWICLYRLLRRLHLGL